MGARIAVSALVDDERITEHAHVDLVGAEQVDDLHAAAEHAEQSAAARSRHEAEIEPGHA